MSLIEKLFLLGPNNPRLKVNRGFQLDRCKLIEANNKEKATSKVRDKNHLEKSLLNSN